MPSRLGDGFHMRRIGKSAVPIASTTPLFPRPTAICAYDLAETTASSARFCHGLGVRLVVTTIPARARHHARVCATATTAPAAALSVASTAGTANTAVTATRLTSPVHGEGAEIMDQLVLAGMLQRIRVVGIDALHESATQVAVVVGLTAEPRHVGIQCRRVVAEMSLSNGRIPGHGIFCELVVEAPGHQTRCHVALVTLFRNSEFPLFKMIANEQVAQ